MEEKSKVTKKSTSKKSKNYTKLAVFSQIFLMALALGSISVFAKITIKILPPFTLIFFQFFLVYLFLSPIVAKRGELNLKSFKNNFTPSLMLVMSYIILYFSLPYVKSLTTTIIYLSSPIILLTYKYIFKKEKISNEQKIGLIIGFLGIFLIIIEKLIGLKSVLLWNNFWFLIKYNLLILLAVIFFVSFKIFSQQKVAKKQASVFSLAYYSSVIAMLISFFPTFFIDFKNINYFINKISFVPHILYIIWLGMFCFYVFLLIQDKTEKKLNKKNNSIYIYLQFLVGLFLVYLFLNEKITFLAIFGGILILLGLQIISKFEKEQKVRKNRSLSNKKNNSIGNVQNGDILKVQVISEQKN